ncbi:hypothetical protein [Niallia sp. Krafla_26]|uniref:hypothetical protein n=1 Tax=Niallia sp. Krafla_26 TaxID=3064703 RepID=UPI003D1747F8
MASKNSRLRTEKDLRQRKKMNGSSAWENRLLASLSEEEPEQPKANEHKRKRGKRDTAKRLSADNL